MSKAKHTPGPWLCMDGDIYSDESDMICNVTGGSGKAYIDEDTNSECLANARLIAAAPEMLAELQNILKEMRGRKLCGHDFTCICSYARLGRVIHKATGGPD